MTALALFARVLVAGLLLVAALAKLRNPSGFAVSLVDLGLIPRRWTRIAPAGALAVILSETVVAVAVAVPATAVVGLGLGAVLFAALTALALRAAARPVPVMCHCFGSAGQALGRAHAYRNAAVSIVAALGLWAYHPGASPDSGTAVLAASAALIAVAGGALMDDVIALLRRQRREFTTDR